ncbi:MAG: hypothetical protein EA393_16485 [Bacteroidetes bacterium]|nr:MAG: hypothetical protein EA393_16485 [Bacteroidota bacterium]
MCEITDFLGWGAEIENFHYRGQNGLRWGADQKKYRRYRLKLGKWYIFDSINELATRLSPCIQGISEIYLRTILRIFEV